MVVAPFRAVAHRQGDTTLVHVQGELDVATVPALELVVVPLLRDGAPTVALDLRDVEFIDVSGVRLALRLEGLAQLHGARFVLVRGRRQVRRLFELTGMERFVPAVDDPGELLAA